MWKGSDAHVHGARPLPLEPSFWPPVMWNGKCHHMCPIGPSHSSPYYLEIKERVP
ncbi:unnamed protein product [Spirodela intermedia]|uniref:Uncharacterized protein n=1 Tax=Spirodela intermedia TaxID=51605 RepID=A0ABN7EB85_SPIIN|nr:unnamed protein product [Spirodela intermedia]